MNCANCGNSIADGESVCDVCQASVQKQNERPSPVAAPPQQSGSAANPYDDRIPDGRPMRFVSTGQWIAAGLWRNPRGVLVSLLATWFSVPVALMAAAVVAVMGGVVGAVGGSSAITRLPVIGDILSFDAFHLVTVSGSIIGAGFGMVLGAVAGLVSGLLGPWVIAFQQSPALGLLGLVCQVLFGVIVGLLYTLFQVRFEPFLLRLKGARRLSRREAALITPIAEQCAETLGILGLPRFRVIDSDEVNAFAGARYIVFNEGLLNEFDYDPEVLAAVISHELTHWNNADAVAAAFVRGVAFPLYLIYIAAMAIIRGLKSHPVIKFVIWFWGWGALVTVRYIIAPAQAADARAGEYRCDQGAVLAGHRTGLRTCLTHLKATVDGARTGWDQTVCALHPPNELRLEAVEEPGVTYVLPDPETPPKPFPVTVVK